MVLSNVAGMPVYVYSLFTVVVFMFAAYALGALAGRERRW